MSTFLIGLGNPILSDDAVGWRVVQEVEKALRANRPCGLEIDCLSLGGLSLMERLVGAERAILVDAIQTKDGVPGTTYRLSLDDLSDNLPTFNTTAIHDASLPAALEMGRSLGACLPEEIVIIAVEAVELWEFGETLTPAVEAGVLPAAHLVLQEIERMT
jgi:hydrogenase maturation protease